MTELTKGTILTRKRNRGQTLYWVVTGAPWSTEGYTFARILRLRHDGVSFGAGSVAILSHETGCLVGHKVVNPADVPPALRGWTQED